MSRVGRKSWGLRGEAEVPRKLGPRAAERIGSSKLHKIGGA